MKKLLSLLVSLFLLTGYCFAATTNSYDKYGSKIGSYRTNGSNLLSMINMDPKQALTDKPQVDITLMIEMANI